MESIITFIIASSLISLAPGPDNIFVLTQSALYGRKSGVYVTLGLCTGLVAHTTAVALGLAAIFASSDLAFTILKFLGAAYLSYLAWQAFKSSASDLSSSESTELTMKALYIRGIIMNITNPKVSIFFLAFLPQFVNPESENTAIHFLALGGIFIVVALIIFLLIAMLAGSLSAWLTKSNKNQIYLNRMAGVVFVGLAVKLLVSSANA